MRLMEFLQRLVSPAPAAKSKPADLCEFDVARKKLHHATRAFVKEVDTFGSMVRDMRAKPSKPNGKTNGKHAPTQKPPCKKRRAKR